MKRSHNILAADFALALALGAALTVSTAAAHADAWDKKTTVSFSQPIEVPGYVLQPGKYVMKLVNFPADRHVVQFMNERENHVYAAAMAVPAYRNEVNDKTVITFYEARAGQPEPIKNWYYPGDNFGQEFVYPKGHLSEIAAVTRETPLALDTPNQTSSTPVTVSEPVKEQTPKAAASQPPESPGNVTAPGEADAPVEISQATKTPSEAVAAPQNQTPPAPAELPQTSSKLPEIAVLGLIFVGGAATVRKLRRS